jgi:hypothetical protein
MNMSMPSRHRMPGRAKRNSDRIWMCPVSDCKFRLVRAKRPPKCPIHGKKMVKANGEPLTSGKSSIEAARTREHQDPRS